jgi:xanthine/CO dehydrogenase XdhC/CoxF family maturation factor
LVAVKPEKALSQCTIDERTAFVVMTHNYNYDFAILRELIRKEARYVGMLGPKKKMTRMLDELAAENITVGKEQLSIVYNPIGLDIGAETPEEIALSILAEITAALSGSQGQPLRDKAEGIIHSRDRTRIEVVNLPVK